ncbi:MAG: DNA polymerase III subunit gamma/tau [Treponema sp.]|jgi:DNA polymerase-3 subunit gamma/tau|nr:DNA polymerase III subunit gamma/tau [Treponema sp.]
MSYEVTATKRRPKTFDELAGQEFVVSTLKNSLESGQIAHAYLFSGPRGCGKTSAARILARSLNCEKGPAAVPCGECANCREIRAGTSMDVIEIDGASNTSVNDVRQIKDEILFPPTAGRYKIYIIDEVHMLSTNAFNALLKTIEEPPHYIVFIFATTELHKVPATIKSRCQQFNFRLIPVETIRDILRDVSNEINIKAEDEALFWIARESTGSLRDAFTLFDQVVSFSEGHIRSEVIRKKLGLLGLEQLNALAEASADNNTSLCFSLIDDILDSGVAVEQFIVDLAGYYRSLLLLKNGITRESLLGYSPGRFSAKAREKFDSVRLERALELLLACYRDIRYSVSPRFELETVISKLSWLDRWIPPPELKAAVEEARTALGLKDMAARPAAFPEKSAGAGETAGQNPPLPGETGTEGEVSFEENFKQYMAARESTRAGEQAGREDEDDVPVWSRAGGLRGAAPDAAGTAGIPPASPAGQAIPPQAKRVLDIFGGTIIAGQGADNEHQSL